MTKQNELNVLKQAVATLGEDSYCGPWLSEQLAQIETDLRNDFFPQHSRRDCLKEIEQMRSDAQKEMEQKKNELKQMEKEFDEKMRKHKDEIWRSVRGLEMELRNF